MARSATITARSKSKAKRPAARERRPGSKGSANAVPMLDLSRQYAAIGKAVEAEIERVCRSQQYVLGPDVHEFEKEAGAFLGVAHAVACASGTDALWLGLEATG